MTQLINNNNAADAIIREAVLLPPESEAISSERDEMVRANIISSKTPVSRDLASATIGGIDILALSNISCIKAKQKQGKTTALMVIVSAILAGIAFRIRSALFGATVLWLDTEQSDYDSKLIVERVGQITELDPDYIDEHLKVLNVRRFDSQDRRRLMLDAIKTFRPQMVIVDGVVDLIDDFNDLVSSKLLVNDLLRIASEYNLALVTVLHTNKSASDHEMRGHLGTLLAQKSWNVFECEKEENIITVKCSDYRHAQPDKWSVRYDDDGNICEGDTAYVQMQERKLVEREAKKTEVVTERRDAIMDIVCENGGSMARKELVEKAMTKLGKSYGTVATILKQLKTSGNLTENKGFVFVTKSPLV